MEWITLSHHLAEIRAVNNLDLLAVYPNIVFQLPPVEFSFLNVSVIILNFVECPAAVIESLNMY